MNYRGHQGSRQEQDRGVVDEFLQKLRELGGDLTKIKDRDIFHPEGYASKIVDELKLKGVQLRRFYSEIRGIYDGLLDGRGERELRYRLYKLYAITQYQENRGVIQRDFGKLFRSILDSLERNFSKENLQKATDFFMAMVAYSKKDS